MARVRVLSLTRSIFRRSETDHSPSGEKMMAVWLGIELCVSECKRETAGREQVKR